MEKWRIKTGGVLLVLVPLGISTKYYHGPFSSFVQNSFGGILYVLFFCLALFFFKPRLKPLLNTVWIFTATSCIEFLQLWHPPILQMIRSTFPGRLLLGTTFVPADFLLYAVGAGVAYGVLRLLLPGYRKESN